MSTRRENKPPLKKGNHLIESQVTQHHEDVGSHLQEPVGSSGHTHTDEHGVAHWCYHKSKDLLTNWKFWLGMTMGFFPEHYLWEKVPPFSYLTHWAGL